MTNRSVPFALRCSIQIEGVRLHAFRNIDKPFAKRIFCPLRAPSVDGDRLRRIPLILPDGERAREHVTIAGRLEIDRRNVLDLGLRNTLLDFRILKSKGVQVIFAATLAPEH
jgi:hypothetical protein